MMDIPVEIGTALILAAQAVIVAWISRVAKNTRIIKGEVKNSHSTNLREEQDYRYGETMGAFAHINSQLSQINQRDIQKSQDIQTISQKLSRVESTVEDHIRWSTQYVRDAEQLDSAVQGRLTYLEENTVNPSKEKQ